MAFRTVAEVKAYAAQMLSQHEDDPVLAGSTAEDLQNLIERFVTASFERIKTYRDWDWLKGQASFTWNTSGISYLPNWVERLIGPISRGVGTDPVIIVSAAEWDQYRDRVPGNYLLIHGWYGVEADMPSATTVTATSASGAAANGLQVRIEGLSNATPGYEQIQTITLAGAGTATTTATFKAGVGGVRSVNIVPGTVPAAGQGILTVTAGGATLERLDPSRDRAHEHLRTELFMASGASGASQTLTCRFIRRAFAVTTSTDLIPIPDAFVDILELGIQIEIARLRKAYGDATGMRTEWVQRMREFSAWSNRQYGDYRTVTAPRIYSSR